MYKLYLLEYLLAVVGEANPEQDRKTLDYLHTYLEGSHPPPKYKSM